MELYEDHCIFLIPSIKLDTNANLACIIPFFPEKRGLEQILQMHRHRNLLQGFHSTMNFENTSGNRPGCETDAKIAKADRIKLS